MKYTIVIIRPPNYPFSDCFHEVAETVMYGLRSLGHEAEMRDNVFRRNTQHIVFGAHLLPANAPLPEGSILYNLEQVGGGNIGQMQQLAKSYPVWDYSRVNVEEWAKKGIEAVHVPVGYVPEMTRITPQHEDIDVLFYGSVNARRIAILHELRRRKINLVVRVNDAYKDDLNNLIARAKIVLNVHYYESKIFEIVRVGYALANKKAVVSEASADDYQELKGGLCIVPYSEIPDACMSLLMDDNYRKALARQGFENFSSLHEADILNAALREAVPA